MRAPDLDEGHRGHQRRHVFRRRGRSSRPFVQDFQPQGVVLSTCSTPARPWWAKLELLRGPVHMSARLAGNNPAEPFICGPGHQAGQRLLAKGRPSRWECRGSAEARPHTERGSGLLNDRTDWLRPAPPEPRTAPTKSTTTFRCLDKTTFGNRKQPKTSGNRKTACCSIFEPGEKKDLLRIRALQ